MTNLFGVFPYVSVLNLPTVFADALDYRIPFYAVLILALLGFWLFFKELNERQRIARLHKAENLLRQSSGLLLAMLRANPMAVIQVDPDGRIEYWNDIAEQMFGWRASEILGQYLPFLPDKQARDNRKMRERVLTGESFVDRELTCQRRDGAAVETRLSCAPVRGFDGAVQGMIVMLMDITDLKRIESEHQNVQAQLRQSQKIETVGRLAGGIAHDFNNLLQVIHGNAEVAAQCVPEGALILEDAIAEIIKAGEKAAQLTHQLLAFSRRQVFKPTTLDLNTVVSDMENMLRRMLGEDIHVRTDFDENLKPILADSGQLGQVIMNLAVNARDAMPHGGDFTLRTQRYRLREHAEAPVPEMAPGEYEQLLISDTGCGMDEAVKTHLFEPFFTTKEKGKGTGLGLATVYGIVKQSGGFIRIDSQRNVGTTCKLYFPATGDAPDIIPPETESEPLTGGNETILLAEDDDGIRRLMHKTLSALGYTVLAAENGNAVLALSDAYDAAIDLLMTDIVMPEISGRELARKLLLKRPTLKVLYMSGFAHVLNAETQHGTAPDPAVLEKPFTLGTLTRRIRWALDEQQAP